MIRLSHHLQGLGGSCLALLAFLVVPWLPRGWIVRLARRLGSVAFRFPSRSRAVALANLTSVYGAEAAQRETVARIACQSFQTMALLILDLFWFSVFSRRRIRKHVHFDSTTRDFFRGRAKRIVLAAHFGNWEILGQAFSLEFEPVSSVASPLKNPFVDGLVRRMREATGQRVIPREGALRLLLKTLREEQAVGLLIDQNTLPADGGLYVEFFGLRVPVSQAVAALYRKERAELAFAYALLNDHGEYEISVSRLTPASGADRSLQGATQAVMGLMEQTIRRHPGHWLWMYKRWKFIPEGRSGDDYPNYARPIEPPEMKRRDVGVA